jgi:AcrR family transcriptional regulator
MARPRTVSDEQIASAARRLFIARGPGLPVAEIADALGVTEGALLYRLKSKEALMVHALCPGAPQVLAGLAEGPERARPLTEQVTQVLEELLVFLTEVVPALVVLSAAGIPAQRLAPAGPAPTVALRRALAAWLSRAARAGRLVSRSPRALADALLGALEARCFNRHVGGASFVEGSDARWVKALVEELILEAAPTKARAR